VKAPRSRVLRRDHPGIPERPSHERIRINLGLRALLLIAAVILFVVAAISDSNFGDLLAWGLACLAGTLLVGETGFGKIGRR
jgi:hypothetical protein